jgi:hypothetical protein
LTDDFGLALSGTKAKAFCLSKEETEMETTEPTLEQIIAAPDPAGELHDARRLLDALVQLFDAFGEGQDPESMVGVATPSTTKSTRRSPCWKPGDGDACRRRSSSMNAGFAI